MRIFPSGTPPELGINVSWRELWLSGSFAQLDLTWTSSFASLAVDRELSPRISDSAFEDLDLAGAFQPIAFAAGGNPPNVVDPSPYEPAMSFREEQPARAWSEYAWDAHGHPHTTAMYSPWQILYLADVLDRASERVPLSLLSGPPDELNEWLERLRDFTGNLAAAWALAHKRWQPLLKLLVRVQNRYLPEVSGRLSLPFDTAAGTRVDVWPREREEFVAADVLDGLGASVAQVLDAYHFMVERGIHLEPRDGMELLRRARPRSAHTGWRGVARQVEDNFEAAQVLRLFLTDLTGAPPGRPEAWPLDGRQPFRAFLYDRGPVPTLTRDEIRGELHDVELDPHAVHVIGEGACEREFVITIAEALAGPEKAAQIGFSDLKGSGSARHLATIVRGLATYVDRTVVIVDAEGDMHERAEDLRRSGELPPEDVLLFEHNLEEDNFSAAELIDVLARIAAEPAGGRPAVELEISLEQLQDAYEQRRLEAGNEPPAMAGVLLRLAEAHTPPVRVSKRRFAKALARRLVDEIEATAPQSGEEREALERRPILRFVVERVIPALYDPSG